MPFFALLSDERFSILLAYHCQVDIPGLELAALSVSSGTLEKIMSDKRKLECATESIEGHTSIWINFPLYFG